MRSIFVFKTAIALASVLTFAGVANGRTNKTGFEPAAPLDSCNCNSVNGVCMYPNQSCTGVFISCNSGYFDCDGLQNGCECTALGQCDSVGCNGATCEHTPKTGMPCSADSCTSNPTCDSTGKCVGTSAPDDTPCPVANCMDTNGKCKSGTCVCANPIPVDMSVPPDLSMPTNPGHSTNGCSAAASTQATPPWALLAVAAVAFVLIRRRRSA